MRPVGPSGAETSEAERLCAEYNVKLRQWAALLIHCADCDGALLATVTWIRGRPLAATQEQGDRLTPETRTRRYWACSWADRGAVLQPGSVAAGTCWIWATCTHTCRLPAHLAAVSKFDTPGRTGRAHS